MGTTEYRILVACSDPEISRSIRRYLLDECFRVAAVADADAMRQVLDGARVDVVILDVRLLGTDGPALIGNLSRYNRLGIIILSSRNDLIDCVAGLECGADDYLAVPFERRELLARIRSVMRRCRPEARDGQRNGRLAAAGRQSGVVPCGKSAQPGSCGAHRRIRRGRRQ